MTSMLSAGFDPEALGIRPEFADDRSHIAMVFRQCRPRNGSRTGEARNLLPLNRSWLPFRPAR